MVLLVLLRLVLHLFRDRSHYKQAARGLSPHTEKHGVNFTFIQLSLQRFRISREHCCTGKLWASSDERPRGYIKCGNDLTSACRRATARPLKGGLTAASIQKFGNFPKEWRAGRLAAQLALPEVTGAATLAASCGCRRRSSTRLIMVTMPKAALSHSSPSMPRCSAK